MMKYILFLSCLMPFCLYGQSVLPFEKQLAALQKAFDVKNTAPLQPYLAEDLTVSDVKGEKALPLLAAILSQLTPVQSISLLKTDTTTEYFNLHIRLNQVDSSRVCFIQLNRNYCFTRFDLAKIKILSSSPTFPLHIDSDDYVEIPFRQLGKLILIENVRINGETGNFLVDTGAPDVIINNQFMKADTTVGLVFNETITGGKQPVFLKFVRIDTLQMSSFRITRSKVKMMDFSHLEKIKKVSIAGLLGYKVWKDYEIHFDFKRHRLCLYKLDAEGHPLVFPYSRKSRAVIPFELQNHLPVFEVKYDTVIIRAVFDSGAETNAISHDMLKKIPLCLYKTNKEKVLTGAHNDTLNVSTVRFPKTIIGGYVFKNMQSVVTSLSHLDLDAILGYELMKRHRLSLNYKRKEIRLY